MHSYVMRVLLILPFIANTVTAYEYDINVAPDPLVASQDLMQINISNYDYSRFIIKNNHPAKDTLDELFKRYDPLASASNLKNAGFTVICERPNTMRVLAHSRLKGYLLKLYPTNEKVNRERDMTWAIHRCLGAENIRTVIKKLKLKHITVPGKWVYYVPNKSSLEDQGIKNYAVLVVDRVNIVEKSESKEAWRNASKEVIKELYEILSRGYSSPVLPSNIPYSREGKFSCLDTEVPERKIRSETARKFLSPEMQKYWDKLLHDGGNTVGFQIFD